MEILQTIVRWKAEDRGNVSVGGGGAIYSPSFRAAGHDWRLVYYPEGKYEKDNVKFVSLFLQLMSTPAAAEGVVVNYELVVAAGSGDLVERTRPPQPCNFNKRGRMFGVRDFVPRSIVDEALSKSGSVAVMARVEDASATVSILQQQTRSGIQKDISKLLESKETCDVQFTVGSEAFAAHKVVLAARSPVFKAQFFGPLADVGSKTSTVPEMKAPVFEALLRFAYTDKIPNGDKPLEDISMLQELLAAADYYEMELLKEMCEEKLLQGITADTVISLLIWATQYKCSVLKFQCLRFIVDAKKAVDVLLSAGYMEMQSHPEVADEIREFKKQRRQ